MTILAQSGLASMNRTAPGTVEPNNLWRDLKAVGIVISKRENSRGRVSIETRYDIFSRLLAVQMFAGAVRGHWLIANNLHWQLDVSFRDDECRVSRDHCASQREGDPSLRPWPPQPRQDLSERHRDQA